MPHVRARRRRSLAAALLVAVSAAVVVPALPAAAEGGGHRRPVDGAVVDPWRPPATPYGAGNRGVDVRTEPGDPVVASAAGEVSFAGPVGGGLHVVVLHPDGIRTSYSFLASVAVSRGQQVAAGEVLGAAGERVHLGARAGDRYLDPTLLWGGPPAAVHLVPTGRPAPATADERGWLGAVVGGRRAAGDGARRPTGADPTGARAVPVVLAAAGAPDLVGPAAAVSSGAVARWAEAVTRVRAASVGAERLRRSQDACTAAATAVPDPPAGRRIVVLVAGFGSSGGRSGILALDTASLGYADDDVVQFSYRGGRVPGVGALAEVPESTYGPADANGDLAAAGHHLHRLLAAVAAAHPGVPVDVIAHSQGGIVARAALAEGSGPVAHLVTLGSPHDGTGLAELAAELAALGVGGAVDDLAGRVRGEAIGVGSPAASQLAAGSAFLRSLPPLPVGLRATSIAARGDLVVPALRSSLPGAVHALVPLDGVSAHGDLPASPTAHREVALALAGAGPTCRRLGADLLTAAAIGLVVDGVGDAVGAGARLLGPRAVGVG